MSKLAYILLAVAGVHLCGCMKWDYVETEDFNASARGLFITNEGNFQYGNATLSFYDPASNEISNEVFLRANGFKLGDVAQSMVVHNGIGWIVVNNSHVIFAINADNFKEVGRIEDTTSPRYIHFISDTKAYVSQLWDNRIFIVDPTAYRITGHIQIPGMTMESGSTEQMAGWGKYVFCCCWSYNNRIIKIDTATDRVVAELEVGLQPASLVIDAYGKIWAVTDGGYEGSPFGHEAPALYKIDAETLAVERKFEFDIGDSPSELVLNGDGTRLYWINDDIWQMDVTASRLPARPFIESRSTIYYGMTVSPYNGDVYVADAIDYQQPGRVYRYSESGELLDDFYAGVNPGAFAWK